MSALALPPAGLALALDAARPWAALALLAPALFLVLLRLVARPREVVVGTLALWKDVPHAARSGARARGRLPPWAWAVALGLVLGALAAVGPRLTEAPVARTWTVVVDRSPSMELATEGGTRLDAALALAEAELARVPRRDRVRWIAPGRASLELARGERPNSAWLAADDDAGAGEPAWARHDEPGTLWVTDRDPGVERRHAGLFAGGGTPVPGVIAADGRGRIVWSADGTLVTEPAVARLAVLVREPPGLALPAVLERMLAAWSAARGLEVLRGPTGALGAGPVLVVELVAGAGEAEPVELARDGWSATGSATRFGAGEETGMPWLVARGSSGPLTVLCAERGRIRLVLHALAEPAGDPARFALSFARLFDETARPAPGAVSLAERRAAGAPRAEPGTPPRGAPGVERGPYVDAALALGAALAALLALFLRG